MTTVTVTTPAGQPAGSVELPDAVFDAQASIPLMHQVVVAQLAAARQGTHSTKTRGEVSGGGKKPYRQKGTGRARQGSTRSPQFVGGGTSHGPQPHTYEQRTPKKMKAAALRGALSDRARGGNVHVLTGLVEGSVPSTKTARAALAAVSSAPNVLVVLDRTDEAGWMSLRNLPEVHLLFADQLNTHDVLVSDDVVFTRAALDAFLATQNLDSAGGVAPTQPSILAEPVVTSATTIDPSPVTNPARTGSSPLSVADAAPDVESADSAAETTDSNPDSNLDKEDAQ